MGEERIKREITEIEAEIDNKKGEIKELENGIDSLKLELIYTKARLENVKKF